MKSKSRIAVGILNWNGSALTRDCVRALLNSTLMPDTIMVLDNGSTANEANQLRKEFSAASVVIERSERNLGFAGGNNYVITQLQQRGTYDYIVLLNQDAVIEPNCLERLVEYLDAHSNVAVVGPLVLNPDGSIQSCGANINLWTGKIVSRLHNQARTEAPQSAELVDCVIGNCFMIRTTALNGIGLLDERYFAYYEEADWCYRAKTAGWLCVVVPQAIIRHSKSGGFRTYLIMRNVVWFQKQHASAIQLATFFLYYFGYFIWERLKKGSPAHELCRASRDGWLNRNIGKA